ncbi:MAG: sugar ABC transporter ATP-binding protein [Anaerolineaceae bacterium]|nr:sugar ABC transporter ATP-binding protein [Anaerolineaceae bacterium]
MTEEFVPTVIMKSISKDFGGVKALDNVDFEARAGEVHALMGENGAGKSTLIKVLSGAYTKDSGEVFITSNQSTNTNTRKSNPKSVSVIYQEFALAPDLTVAENIYIDDLGDNHGIINWKTLKSKAEMLLKKLGFSEIDVLKPVSELSVAYQQVVEICKALHREAKVLVLDEPTAVLTKNEIDKLFGIITELKAKGVCIIYVSHRIEEVFRICDRITVLKDGKKVDTVNVCDIDREQLVRMMIGREMKDYFPLRQVTMGDIILQVNHLNCGSMVRDVSLNVKKGEVLGLSGLVGAGRTETIRAIFGAEAKNSGQIIIENKPVNIISPRDAVACGLGMLPEDRKQHGVLLDMSIKMNGTLTILDQIKRSFGRIDKEKEEYIVADLVKRLHAKIGSMNDQVNTLSGGNQQKISLMKWIASNSKILLLDEPTRGVDVGAKVEIYKIINELAAQGVGIILISSELPEIIGMCDRALVMRNGMIAGELVKEEITEYNLIRLAMGV